MTQPAHRVVQISVIDWANSLNGKPPIGADLARLIATLAAAVEADRASTHAHISERTDAGPTPEMVDAALNAWFASPPSETDQGLERSMKAALVAAGIDLSASGRTTYEWRDVAELPPWDEQPGRQFIRLEGSRDHSGVNWHRVYCGIAYIRRPGEPDEMLGYRDTDIIQLCDEGDMDLFSATVTHWMPARFPAIPAPVSGSTEGGNG
ncbi:hypothetical protein [Bradyrhizobium elkanii]|uniref:hypothetical protein n=1 Tax=Bradyrhizobium elkanii TaxID=29448 RepID=UPI00272B7BFD|nr:hypothetical protein [Bradyrhizobium elkanii]WLA80374.1 hypothetical protein QNJ99_34065 [Bradyrhizobium elkanii]